MGRGANFFRHGELPVVLLALLADKPMHGYELLSKLNEVCSPRYDASTGSLYPAVAALRDTDLISERSEGRRRTFHITSAGRDALAANLDRLSEFEARTGASVQDGANVDALLAQFSALVREHRRDVAPDCLAKELNRACRALGVPELTRKGSERVRNELR